MIDGGSLGSIACAGVACAPQAGGGEQAAQCQQKQMRVVGAHRPHDSHAQLFLSLTARLCGPMLNL